jgi:group I intron endonuclease
MTPRNIDDFYGSDLKSGLYVITCLPLEKHYVGQSQHVGRRLNAHKSTLRRGCHDNLELQADYREYGVDEFVFQKLLLGATLPKHHLERLETLVLSTLSPEQRYNTYTNWRTRGSETNPFLGRRHTLEARYSQGTARRGKVSSFAGHKQSDEVRQSISRQNSGSFSKDRRKPLFIDSVFYESVSDASAKTGLARRLIRERCHSTEQRFTNYQWYHDSSIE